MAGGGGYAAALALGPWAAGAARVTAPEVGALARAGAPSDADDSENSTSHYAAVAASFDAAEA